MVTRRWVFALHGWLTLPVWVLFCFVSITGTLAVISHEITWLANPAARATNPEGLAAKPLSELMDAAQRAVPGGEVTRALVYEPYLAVAVGVSQPGAPPAIVYVNPYTGAVQSVGHGQTFIGFMRALHGWLLIPWRHAYSVGYYLVAALSLVVLGAMFTGVVVYRKFWRAYTRLRLRTGQGVRVLAGDFHRLAGAWSLWFLLIMGATGLWYLVQAGLWHAGVDVQHDPPPIALSALPTGETAPPRVGVAHALEQARAAFPGLRPALVAPPEHNRDYYQIAGAGEAWMFDRYSYRVWVDPWRGDIVQAHGPADMSLLQLFTHLADPLHYGTFGGLWTKAIWFVFGLLLSGMSVAGFVIWLKRHGRKGDVER